MLARRSIFGLAAGGVAALADRGQLNARVGRRFLPPAYAGECDAQSVGGYVESAARQLLNTKIEDERAAFERRQARLSRLRSVSQAFVDAQRAGHYSVVSALYKQLSNAR